MANSRGSRDAAAGVSRAWIFLPRLDASFIVLMLVLALRRKVHQTVRGLLLATWSCIALTRLGWHASVDTMWAEDGLVFLQQARDHGLASILDPYNGYLHIAPRLLALPISFLPLPWAAAAMSLAAAATTAGCAAIVWTTSSRILPAPASIAMASWLVLIPMAGFEMVGNITYLQWFLLAAGAWILIVPEFGQGSWLSAVFFLVTATSSPQSVVLLPLAIFRTWRLPVSQCDRRTLGLLCGMVIQLSAIFSVPGGEKPLIPDATILRLGIESFFGRVLLGAILGDVFNAELAGRMSSVPYLVLGCTITIALASMLAMMTFRPRIQMAPIAWFVGLAVALFSFCIIFRGVTPSQGFLDARYVAISGFFLASAGILALVQGTRGIHWPVAIAFAIAGLACMTSYDTPSPLREGPSWSHGLEEGEAQCQAMRGHEFLIDGKPVEPVIAIPISPEGWSFQIRCSEIDPGWFGPG